MPRDPISLMIINCSQKNVTNIFLKVTCQMPGKFDSVYPPLPPCWHRH